LKILQEINAAAINTVKISFIFTVYTTAIWLPA
jgi:hypothetical protein